MIKLTIFGILITLTGLELKQLKPEYANLISLTGCVIIFSSVCTSLSGIVGNFLVMLDGLGINSDYMTCIVKIIGTAYLSDFSCNICKDAGFSALSSQIEIFAKLYMLTISLPVVIALLDTVNSLWG